MENPLYQQLDRDGDVLVLGAGVVGINTAYWLAKRGRSVTVIDRREAVAMETSYANGGQVSVCHAEPWANPRAPWQVLRWLVDARAPLSFRPRLDTAQWRWLLQWLLECTPSRARNNTVSIVDLALHSRQLLKRQREEHGLDYLQSSTGILHFYRTQAALDSAKTVSQLMRDLGCDRRVVTADRAFEIEPALLSSAGPVVGGTYTAGDESGDAHLYTKAMRAVCESMGVRFVMQAEVQQLTPVDGGAEVALNRRDDIGLPSGDYATVRAKEVVVALGTASSALLKPLGISLNIYPAKGYSMTVPIAPRDTAPTVSLTDDENKLVFSRLDDHLRIAGMAELSGYNQEINRQRCETMTEQVKALFPHIEGYDKTEYWAGLRPSTPSNRPYVGASSIPHIWLNTGHGSLGWTMSCGSGERLARQILLAGGQSPV